MSIYGLTVSAYQNDASGELVGRRYNEIALTVYFTTLGIPVYRLTAADITVGSMTAGAGNDAVVIDVLPGNLPGSFHIGIGQLEGEPAWEPGVHLFAVAVSVGGFSGRTLATVHIRRHQRIPRPERPEGDDRGLWQGDYR